MNLTRACSVLSVLTVALSVHCASPLPDRRLVPVVDAGAEATPTVTIEPPADAAAAPAVLRLSIDVPDASGLGLYRGTLSRYHLGRIERHDVPKTLLERRVPTRAWRADGGAVVLAPTVVLEHGETYSAASPRGLLSVLRVEPAPSLPVLGRAWPPRDAGGARHVVLCGEATPRLDPIEVPLGGASATAVIAAGADSRGAGVDLCLHLRPTQPLLPGATYLPPPRAAGVALDPAPLFELEQPDVVPADCEQPEITVLDGCLSVLDDRVVLRSFDAPSFWILESDGRRLLQAVAPGGRVVLGGFVPKTRRSLHFARLDLRGTLRSEALEVVLDAPRPHLVLNEVMANPLGVEPDQEWIEIVNDGTTVTNLGGFTLADVGGEVVLPDFALSPGDFVLVVSEAFDPASRWDMAPAPGTPLVRVASLGKNGLANSGEPLELWSPDGVVVSRWPRLPKPKAGISVARRTPASLDDDPGSFALHAADGASPGAPNQVD